MKIRNVGVFVDFNSRLLAVPNEFGATPEDRCGFALRGIGKAATKHLCALETDCNFRVRLRLYHGWTTGVTHTPNRRAVSKLPEFDEPDTLFNSRRIIAMGDIEFGDRLIDALPRRENAGLRIHLPDTSRRQRKGAPMAEKMVDTAIAADLLSWARSEPSSIALVFSSDDDIVPPVFVAESWMSPLGGSVSWITPTDRTPNKYLALEGLLAR